MTTNNQNSHKQQQHS